MSEALTLTDEDEEAMLAELAGMIMSATRAAHSRLMAAPDDEAFHAAGRTFQRLGRALRQTFAIRARLKRERATLLREGRETNRAEREARVATRKAQLRAAADRMLWTEHEREAMSLRFDEEIAERIEAEALADDFLDQPMAVLAESVLSALGLGRKRVRPPPVPVDSSA